MTSPATVTAPAEAVAEVDGAIAALRESVDGRLPTPASDGFAVPPTDPARALLQAQTLVARLVLGHTATSPTLLPVRLARLRRALVAVAEQE